MKLVKSYVKTFVTTYIHGMAYIHVNVYSRKRWTYIHAFKVRLYYWIFKFLVATYKSEV